MRRRVVRVGQAAVLAASGALLLSGPARSRPADALGWTASTSPFRLAFVEEGRPLLRESDTAGGPGGRLSYRLADGSFHKLTDLLSAARTANGDVYRVATDESTRTATVAVSRTPTGARVSLTFQPATDVADTFEAFAASPSEHFLGGGERPQPLDLRGQALAIKVSYDCRNTMPAPFFLSSAGYGVALRTSAVASVAFPGSVSSSACPGGATPRCPIADRFPVVQVCVKQPTLAYAVYRGTPQEIVSAYTGSVGRPRIPPASQFELIKWRDSVSGPQELIDDVDRLHSLRIPIGWILLDNPWETDGCYGTMRFDAKFGDPKRLTEALHARGVRFMLWVSPLVRRQWCPRPAQYPQGALLGTGGSASTIDLTDPGVRASFTAALKRLIGDGVDGFKADRGDEIDLETEQLAGGAGLLLHNLFPLLYDRAIADAVRAAGLSTRFATLARAGAPGSAALLPGFWGGDQAGTFAGLVEAIHDGLSAGVAGYPVWGSDTGGFGPTQSAEVFVRWAQFSAVSPIFEVGGMGRNATFWNFGPRPVAMFRNAVALHYELFPYLYSLARAAHASGLPILRPLAFADPTADAAWRYDTEVLVGPDLLAAPVATPATGGVASESLFLPAGTWVDLATGRAVRGGTRPFLRRVPLSQLPLYLRAAAAIPFAARTPAVWREPWPTDDLFLPGRGGWLYAPGEGRTTRSDRDFGRFTARDRAGRIAIDLQRAPRETQVLIATNAKHVTVVVDGHALPRAGSASSLRRLGSGWTFTTGPFRGIALKLVPAHGRSHVVLRLRR
jgi:alpha-D-xyloside xylohydrolase